MKKLLIFSFGLLRLPCKGKIDVLTWILSQEQFAKTRDFVFFQKIVKSSSSVTLKKLLLFLCCLFPFLLAVNCVKRVSLPDAPSYQLHHNRFVAHRHPSYLTKIIGKIRSLEPALWQNLEKRWNLKRIWGRFLLRLDFQDGTLLRCSFERSDLHVTGVDLPKGWQLMLSKKHHRRAIPMHRLTEIWRQERESRQKLCEFLLERRWSAPKTHRGELIPIYILFKRDRRQARVAPPKERKTPPAPHPKALSD